MQYITSLASNRMHRRHRYRHSRHKFHAGEQLETRSMHEIETTARNSEFLLLVLLMFMSNIKTFFPATIMSISAEHLMSYTYHVLQLFPGEITALIIWLASKCSGLEIHS